MSRCEAEEIYMANQVGANFPKELLPMAYMILATDKPCDGCDRCKDN